MSDSDVSTPLFDPKRDFCIERVIDAPVHRVWEALTTPEHINSWYMPRQWGRVVRTALELRPGGMFRIDIAVGDGPEIPNLGCVLEVVPLQRLVWTSMLFPGYRSAVFDDIPITAVMTMEAKGEGTRYRFTALHRSTADLDANLSSGFFQGTEIAVTQFVEHVMTVR